MWEQPAPELQPGARPNAAGMSLPALKALVAGLGESPFRAGQLYNGLYRRRWTACAT